MTIDWNAIGPTAADWAATLERLVNEAMRAGQRDHAVRDALDDPRVGQLVDQLTEFIARSPAIAAELDRLAAKVIDDLLATEVRARLERLAMRASELGKHVDYLRGATQRRAGTASAPGATRAGVETVREQAHAAAAAASKRLLPEVESVLERVRALRPRTGR